MNARSLLVAALVGLCSPAFAQSPEESLAAILAPDLPKAGPNQWRREAEKCTPSRNAHGPRDRCQNSIEEFTVTGRCTATYEKREHLWWKDGKADEFSNFTHEVKQYDMSQLVTVNLVNNYRAKHLYMDMTLSGESGVYCRGYTMLYGQRVGRPAPECSSSWHIGFGPTEPSRFEAIQRAVQNYRNNGCGGKQL